jgi:hypothetical protein
VNALTLIQGGSLPPARARLVDVTRRISDAERHLRTLQTGKAALEREAGRVSAAKAELAQLVDADAQSLVDRLRSGANWALSAITQARTHSVAAQLSQSRVEASVAEAALKSVAEEVAKIERSISEMQEQKQDAVRATLIESAGGFRYDLQTALEHVREALVALVAMDRITSRSDGSYQPNERVVIEIPPICGLPAQAIVAPDASIASAQNVWEKYSQTVAENPLASVDGILFPAVNPNADDGRVTYDKLTRTEKARVDQARSLGVK